MRSALKWRYTLKEMPKKPKIAEDRPVQFLVLKKYVVVLKKNPDKANNISFIKIITGGSDVTFLILTLRESIAIRSPNV